MSYLEAWSTEEFVEAEFELVRWSQHGDLLRRVVKKIANWKPRGTEHIPTGPWYWEVRDFAGGSKYQGNLLVSGVATTRRQACQKAMAAADRYQQ